LKTVPPGSDELHGIADAIFRPDFGAELRGALLHKWVGKNAP